MSASPPIASHATGSQHPLLRRRMLNSTPSFTEASRPDSPASPLVRRRSSLISNISESASFRETKAAFRKEHGIMDKLTTTDTTSIWFSTPLFFITLPVVGGLLANNGDVIVSDICLLILACIFLDWCIRTPWKWYYLARDGRYALEASHRATDPTTSEANIELNIGMQPGSRPENQPGSQPTSPPSEPVHDHVCPKPLTEKQQAALIELARQENWAMAMCFIGPVLGAFFLHKVREQLSRPVGGFFKNFNLCIFVLAAELQPLLHVTRQKQGEMDHVRRYADGGSSLSSANSADDLADLSRRLAEVQARLDGPTGYDQTKAQDFSNAVRRDLQSQLDALNRAIRRYERKHTALTMQVEARFSDFETRLQDALSLAAVAARDGQRPGVILMVLTWAHSLVSYSVESAWALITWPVRTAVNVGVGVSVKTEPQPLKPPKLTQDSAWKTAYTTPPLNAGTKLRIGK